MQKQVLVQSIETLKLGNPQCDYAEIMRITTKDGEQIIGLPMRKSHKSSEHMPNLDIAMLYIPQQQTVMNLIELELTEGSICVLEACGKQCFQPELQFFWNKCKDNIMELFNRHSNDRV